MHVLGLHVVFVVAVPPLLHVFFVCDPVSLIRIAYRSLGEGLFTGT